MKKSITLLLAALLRETRSERCCGNLQVWGRDPGSDDEQNEIVSYYVRTKEGGAA